MITQSSNCEIVRSNFWITQVLWNLILKWAWLTWWIFSFNNETNAKYYYTIEKYQALFGAFLPESWTEKTCYCSCSLFCFKKKNACSFFYVCRSLRYNRVKKWKWIRAAPIRPAGMNPSDPIFQEVVKHSNKPAMMFVTAASLAFPRDLEWLLRIHASKTALIFFFPVA